ncbi:urease accessory protein UreD [Gordonia sp. CPCC 205333]|uniref:urease accessory protein UreD n=1 Tax=Gordonia sp. CPCC 205333 TaxID=3140790 RepID=UPI003AF37422
MPLTRVAIRAGAQVASVQMASGLLVPRLISRTASDATIALVAGGALLLGGDRVEIEITVGPGCRLELTDIGGTVAYDAQGEPSSWAVRIVVGVGGVLCWHGLPLVVATGANVTRTMRVDLAEDARAVVRETSVLGRAGEQGGRMCLRMDVIGGGLPIVVESVEIDPRRREPGILGTQRVLDTVLAVGFRPPTSDVDLRLEEPGAIARYLGAQTHTSTLDQVWEQWRGAVYTADESLEELDVR